LYWPNSFVVAVARSLEAAPSPTATTVAPGTPSRPPGASELLIRTVPSMVLVGQTKSAVPGALVAATREHTAITPGRLVRPSRSRQQ
jgi:hypothetical protein